MTTAVAQSTYEDSAYLARLRTGEEAAFERMVHENIDKLYAYATRMLRNASEAADAVQEAFMDARRGLASFRGESRLTTWLHRILHRRCLQIIRKRKNNLDIDELAEIIPDREKDVLAPLEDQDLSILIKAELDGLPDAQRQAISLFYFSSLSYEEIATTMNIPVGTVRTHIHRGKAALRSHLVKKGVGNYV